MHMCAGAREGIAVSATTRAAAAGRQRVSSICEFAPGAELRYARASCGVALLQKKLSKQATGMSTPLEDEAGTALRSVAKLC
jgi:hypothetical protein